MQWCYLPSIYELTNFPVVEDIVDAGSSVIMSPSSFQPVIAQLPTLIPEWISTKRAGLISMLEPPPPVIVELDNPLNLATGTHLLGGDRWALLPGDEEFVSASHNPMSLGASRLGASTASLLICAAGLDPSLATIAEMDALDLCFACLECPLLVPQFRSKIGTRTEEAQWIKQNEQDTLGNPSVWTCNHSADHFNNWRGNCRPAFERNNWVIGVFDEWWGGCWMRTWKLSGFYVVTVNPDSEQVTATHV
ncbi:hypothetical protein BD779DRAFT_1475127 [Infundibulicybe gibba]|nr:hypothetical protein BD779DRAFT_1475127 [Infundibulicybe gibba]